MDTSADLILPAIPRVHQIGVGSNLKSSTLNPFRNAIN